MTAAASTLNASCEPRRSTRLRWPDPRPLSAGAMSCTFQDAAVTVGLSVATLRRRAAEGKLRSFKIGRRTLVCAASLRAMLTAA
jgi:hypothetical protein